MLRLLLQNGSILGMLVLTTFTAEAREISVSLTSGQATLVLNNPSSSAVTYSVACFNPSGAAANSFTSQSLAPNASASHEVGGVPDLGTCAAAAAPNGTFNDAAGKSVYLCAGSKNLASAGDNCGQGQAFCFPDISCSTWQCGASSYWLKNDGSAQYQPSCGTYAAITGGNGVAIGMGYSGYAKKTSSNCAYFGAATMDADSTLRGTVCCSSPASAAICKVTITSTSPNAYLSSPSFMGGASF